MWNFFFLDQIIVLCLLFVYPFEAKDENQNCDKKAFGEFWVLSIKYWILINKFPYGDLFYPLFPASSLTL